MFESFFAGNTKENYEPLNLVSVHYRNKALIKDIGVNSFKTYCKQYFIVLLSILINLLRTEMSEIHSDEAMKAYDKILLKMLDAITLYV